MIKIQLKNSNRLIFLIKTKPRKPAWTRQLPINLNNNQNPVEIRVQNQSQSHEFDQKELKTYLNGPKLVQNQSRNPSLDSGLATNLNNHQEQV
jgi:hypothetical protein